MRGRGHGTHFRFLHPSKYAHYKQHVPFVDLFDCLRKVLVEPVHYTAITHVKVLQYENAFRVT